MQIDIYRTRVSVTFPFAAVVTLMLLICDSDIVFISLLSSLFHEFGHIFFLAAFHEPPTLICFGAFGIRIERGKGSLSCKKEALVAMGGVMCNFLLALFGTGAYIFCGRLWGVKLAAVNAFIALFNMLPVRLLDFGRFLECVLFYKFKADKAEKILSELSFFTTALILVLCLLYNIFIGLNVSLIAVSIYIILITTLKE